MEVDREMQKRHLIALAKSPGGFQFTRTFFPYTSNEIGPYYVQSAAIMADGQAYSVACQDMAIMIRKVLGKDLKEDVIISGGESRDWCFSGPVAQNLSLPHTMIYKRDESGQCKVIGASMKGKNVVHVADLSNEGSSPRDMWVPTIRGAGGKIEHIFFYVDRLEDGVEEMKKLGLQSHAVIPLDESAWQYMQEIGVVSPEIYKSLCKRMENKDEWAKAMLRSRAGLETLVALLASSKTREKGQKILSVGYPDIKDEIIDTLKAERNEWPGVVRWLE
jgi:orotate phosphoribosyltransferase